MRLFTLNGVFTALIKKESIRIPFFINGAQDWSDLGSLLKVS